MAYEFTFTPRFQKHFRKLTEQEKNQLKIKLKLLAENPSHPSLRTKRIQGTADLFECSVNMDIRIIWYYEGNKMIILIDVGHHDILTESNKVLAEAASRIGKSGRGGKPCPCPDNDSVCGFYFRLKSVYLSFFDCNSFIHLYHRPR